MRVVAVSRFWVNRRKVRGKTDFRRDKDGLCDYWVYRGYRVSSPLDLRRFSWFSDRTDILKVGVMRMHMRAGHEHTMRTPCQHTRHNMITS